MNIIIGRKPVLEALNSNEEIEQVYILFGQQGNIINAIRLAAKKRGIKCNQIPLERFRTYAPSQNTQGVVALKQDFNFSSLDTILSESKKSSLPLILILDEIQDPHNVGAILRSAECSGVNGIIITKHNSATITSTVSKVSAGATEHLKICQVNNLSQTIDELKEKGFWIVHAPMGTDASRGLAQNVTHGYCLCVSKKPRPKPDWDRLYEIAAAQDGHFTTQQAADAGYSLHALLKHVKAGRVARDRRGVYRLVHFPAGDREDLAVIWLWSDRVAVFSHHTALSLHGLSDVMPNKIDVTLPSDWQRRRLRLPKDVVVHHADVPSEERAWFGAVPATSPARTLNDCAKAGLSV